MKHTKTLQSSTFPMFVAPRTNWSGGTYIDAPPSFRQLPSMVVTNPAPIFEADDADRRAAFRRDIQLGIEIYGYDGELSLIHAYGTTRDVSASGLFAFVDVDLPIGARAVVAVRPSHPALEPSILRGKVVRCAEQNNGYGLAVHFDLDVERFAFDDA